MRLLLVLSIPARGDTVGLGGTVRLNLRLGVPRSSRGAMGIVENTLTTRVCTRITSEDGYITETGGPVTPSDSEGRTPVEDAPAVP